MMRWKAVILILLLGLAITAGCKQDCFMNKDDMDHYRQLGLPPCAESDVASTIVPRGADVPPPPTVDFPERKPQPLSLAEAIAIALEHGSVGSPQLNGTTSDDLVTLQGRAVVAAESPIRVLALEPAIAATDIDTSLSKFDARFTGSMIWNQTDQPTGGNVIQDLQNGQGANFSSSVLKPLPTGGVAGITFSTQYTDLFNPPFGVTNPQYRPRLQFQFEQPLLQGFGVEINELRANHPGSQLTPFNTNTGVDGIIITRAHFDQTRAEFEREVHVLVTNVEVAYWNLYGAYYGLFSREQILDLSLRTYRFTLGRYREKAASTVDLAQAKAQYESFRAQRSEALAAVLDAEHQLRGLLGLPVEDGKRLVPIDTPTLAPFHPDWYTALSTALATRPELVLAREDLKQRQFALMNQKNLLLPDVRFVSTYDINSLGTDLAGGGSSNPNNAFANLARNKFHDYQFGIQANWVFGHRAEYAGLRAAKLRLAQGYLTLRDQENRAERTLAQYYRQLASSYAQIQAQRAQRIALGQELEGRYRAFAARLEDTTSPTALSFLLDTQRFYADTLRAEYAAVVDYNNSLAHFEYARGTILQRDNVYISEGPLPHCAQVRAVEHERKRHDAILLRERQCFHYNPVDAAPRFGTIEDGREGAAPQMGLLLNDADNGAVAPPVPPIYTGKPPAADEILPAAENMEAPGAVHEIRMPSTQLMSHRPATATANDQGLFGMILDAQPATEPAKSKGSKTGMILDGLTLPAVSPDNGRQSEGMILPEN